MTCLSGYLNKLVPYQTMYGKPSVAGSCRVHSRSGDPSPSFDTLSKGISARDLKSKAYIKDGVLIEGAVEAA
jgi:hypothetical protein